MFLPVFTLVGGKSNYTPVHLVESVKNCGLFMRRYLACSSYANVMHQELSRVRELLRARFVMRPKKKTSLFPVAGLKIAMRNAVFFFFFLQFMKKQCAMRFLFF